MKNTAVTSQLSGTCVFGRRNEQIKEHQIVANECQAENYNEVQVSREQGENWSEKTIKFYVVFFPYHFFKILEIMSLGCKSVF